MPACDVLQQLLAALPLIESDRPAEQFLVIRAGGEPRWLLPQSCRNIDSVLSSWSPYRFSSRLKWQAVRAANRIGAVHLLPSSRMMEIAHASRIDWRSMGWIGNAPPAPVIYVGTPGVSRKAAIHLVDRESGKCCAIVRVPLTGGARQAILREAGMLASLAEEKCAVAPRLLFVNDERGVSTQTFIPGMSGERRFSASCGDLLRSLMLKDETTTIAQHAASLEDSIAGDLQLRVVRAAVAELNDTHLLPTCWVHGDFAPWNIKRRQGQPWMLIDWEDARRGGLPLQDYFHFLHMQDYLFGVIPALHSAAAKDFARTIGVPPTLCRQLEITYLADSYLRCIGRQEQAHADFLLRTIGLALQGRPHPVFISNLRADTSGIGHQSDCRSQPIRSQLLAAMIAHFNASNIRYSILSGHENDIGTDTSDVDVMVHPSDMPRIPALLAASARSTGGSLIQAIRHETSACYFVLAKHDNRSTGFLDPDCCGDYRRNGRLWMSASEVIARRMSCHDFYVPSVADEFIYYLLKKVLKRSVTADQLRRLQQLYSSEPGGCQRKLARFWPQTTALAMQQALVESDLTWFSNRLPDLLLELSRSAPVECRFDRLLSRLREFARRVERTLYPTGMSVLITGGESSLRSNVADDLMESLAPAFRRTKKVSLSTGFRPALCFSARAFVTRCRSTLIVGIDNFKSEASGLQFLRSKLVRLLFRPDLVLALETRSTATVWESARSARNHSVPLPWRTRTVCLDANLSVEQIVADAAHTILDWLAARLEGRLTKSSAWGEVEVPFHLAEPAKLHSAGLD